LSVQGNLSLIKERIFKLCEEKNRHVDEINIIAVTKYVSIDRTKEAIKAGIKHVGENREEGLLTKISSIQENPSWHFIGSLQTKKVKKILPYIDYIHSLDRLSLAREINKRAEKVIKCFVQVNVSGEESKHGLKEQDVLSFIKELKEYNNILVIGLMTMAPYTEDKTIIRNCFKKLRHLKESVQALQLQNAPCTELSMGMSNDFEIAIEEGATFIRLGTSLVGKEL
jgi:PLP dependent protein